MGLIVPIALASSSICPTGVPQRAEARAGVLGSPSSLPLFPILENCGVTGWFFHLSFISSIYNHMEEI
jgi:hypothetical protein